MATVFKTRAGEVFPALPEGYRYTTHVGHRDILIGIEQQDGRYDPFRFGERWVGVETFRDHADGSVSSSTEDFDSLAEGVATVLARRRLEI